MKYIYIGKIVNTHGIKGEVRLLSNFKFKDKIFVKDMNIYIGKNKDKEVINTYRPHKQFDMITMNGYSNINEVLKYKGEPVYIDSEDLKLGKDEYLDEDLINLDVIIDNEIVGKIKRVDIYPKQSYLVVKTEKKDCLIPYVSDIIEEINFKEGFIRIENIKGLI
ncbi:MAG: ribosome maturation factor RimM [Bacilli bacterium]|nr:ribosome maturation factor RimM [Bacilli bacterium]